MSSTLIRPLGGFEQMFWLRAQTTTVHFTLAGEVEGATSPAQWAAALHTIQKIHPMLSVGIRQEKDSSLWFEHRPGQPIPFRVVVGKEGLRWEAELEKELSLPFENDAAPLMRAVLVHYPDKCIIMLVAHHSIADGLSLSYIIRDLLEVLRGKTLTPFAFPPSVDQLLGLTGEALKGPPFMVGRTPLRLVEKTKIVPRMYTQRLSPELTARLIRLSHEEGCTVHGAVISALVSAGRSVFPKWKEKAVRVLSPISVRNLSGAGEECALRLGAKMMAFQPEENRSFWDLSRFVRALITEAARLETIKEDTTGLRKFVDGMDVAGSEAISERFNRELVVSNIGRVGYDTRFGWLRLTGLWGPSIHSGFEDEFSMALCTVDDSCCLLVTSREPNGQLLLAETVKLLERYSNVYVSQQ